MSFNRKTWLWSRKDLEFIEVLKQYENNDAFALTRRRLKDLWEEIAKKVGMPANYSRRKWIGIKHNYFKIMYMIRKGRVTVDRVRNNIKTWKYLDGNLDFLDRLMFKIPEAELSSSAHNFFDSVFPCTQSESSVEKLIKVKENSVIEVIEDYKKGTGEEPMSILPNIEIYGNGSSITDFKETFVNLGKDQAVKENFRIDDHSNDIVFEEPDILPDIQISTRPNVEFVNFGMVQAMGYPTDDDLNDVQFVAPDMLPNITLTQEGPISENAVTNVTNSILKNILSSTENKGTKRSKPNCALAKFFVKYANTKIYSERDEDCNLKEYMNDLAEVLCSRLVEPGKRKHFLSQIDLIVSEILERR